MPSSPSQRRYLLIAAAVVLLVGAAGVGYWLWGRSRLPGSGNPVYEQYVEAFQVGVAALDADVPVVAGENLNKVVGLIPQEPAGWADRGLFHLRTGQLDQAAKDLAEANRLAPDHPEIEKLLGLLDQRRGKFTEAVTHFRKAVERDPTDVETLYRLAQIVDQEHKEGSEAEYQRLMEQILTVRPDNLHVLVDRLRVAVRRSDRPAVQDTLTHLRRLAPTWADLTRKTFAEMETALAGPLGESDVFPLLTFANVLRSEPGYSRTASEVSPPDAFAGNPLRTFVKLTPPRNSPAPPDADLTFTPEPLADIPAGRWDAVTPFWLTGDTAPVVFAANAREVRRTGAGLVLPSIPVAPDGLIPIDWDNDFRTDLLLVGPGGLKFFKQGNDGGFTDVTAKTGLGDDILRGDYATALAADVDLDGDLDILLARRKGPPLWLRNNFDGTFTPLPIFAEVDSARQFVWADFDNDGAADAAILDAAGKLHVYSNERSAQFRKWPADVPNGSYRAVTVADVNDDGIFDVVALRGDGALMRVSAQNKRAGWEVAEIARWGPPPDVELGVIRLLTADLDNNGVPDLIVSGPSGGAAWLGGAGGTFQPLAAAVPARVSAAVDLTGSGRPDLLGLDAEGRPVRYRNVGRKDYHWQTIRFRAAPAAQPLGDNRINSYGIGGEIELRTGTHVVKRMITAPAVHLGLGERPRADVVRIQWPNGTSQYEFQPLIDQGVVSEQRLKGSCPFLFGWNGEKFAFLADFMWSTPLGMYINAQDKGGFLQTAEWVKIRGDQLVPKDGHYELRVNANLWETHYFDHMALHVVDHPAGTELFVDERFALEPSTPHFQMTGPTRPIARAWDHLGGDATEAVRANDGVYLDRCGRGLYQGVTNDHWVEVDLGDDAPKDGPVWLIARGWIHPTDSSINYALEQGRHERPRGLVLEVPDGKGGWKVARDKIGFPAGKNKTILVRLDGLDGPGVARRFRLRTNMEIFWDSFHYAQGRDGVEIAKKELLPVTADLRSRGILEMTRANPSSPELPDYDRLVARGQVWRDLIGYHTRFGDIRELLEKVDDRYAILTAGDDIAMRFAAPPAPPSGWVRDFVWVSDGWVKDGDLNTRYGKTVLPLPSHNMTSYEAAPDGLENDPVYRRFPKDWERFHTRFVAPDVYERGLRPLRTEAYPAGGQP
ncbi:FG-GAP-like repeat-containing protein [Fimbriiglobus ruber]|uniref:ASPIC/UnbV domain-containing protein n=1 Tax=Fimbriiglobus ruber TaxID=1908690 RepID=A0A225D9Q0_9BACT|nr:FG-GAP-like repeat-containing protein [Fimbriiglobus ruber]OWK38291.1 hypothetical protein FRUB_07411 [Fimbriiglobus ruber]